MEEVEYTLLKNRSVEYSRNDMRNLKTITFFLVRFVKGEECKVERYSLQCSSYDFNLLGGIALSCICHGNSNQTNFDASIEVWVGSIHLCDNVVRSPNNGSLIVFVRIISTGM